MIKNVVNEKETCRRIVITKENEVILTEKVKFLDEKEVSRTEIKEKYQLLTIFKVGNDKFAQCVKGGTVDWYNLRLCQKILSLDKTCSIRVVPVAGESYIKVVDEEEEYGLIYDSVGNLIAKEKKPVIIDIVFSGVGACLQKTDESGKKTLYTKEGYLVG